jgi:hypothetical protein
MYGESSKNYFTKVIYATGYSKLQSDINYALRNTPDKLVDIQYQMSTKENGVDYSAILIFQKALKLL